MSTNREEKVKVWPCTVELFEKKAYDAKRVYKNYTEWRGRAVIINNVSFDNEFSLDRKGTEVDVEYLKSLFRQLHYLVLKHDNLTAEAIDQLATREARTDHSAYSSFIMVILSHGGENTVIGTDGYHIGYDQILAHFEASRCPTLNGKPKMFFISACQGIQKAPLFNTEQAPPRPQDRETPEKADMILVTSTTRGDKSWRSTERGTFFIQCLVKSSRKEHVTPNYLIY
ncbi:caspase-8-like [Lingula anatina]|uniref:Caspase-8-like n=1 Tax=Lingula anatina TaxID=7574 RepID=A0A1S3JGZ7_LINAN|nr:caspase-8-like [Lingula anatina]|eukprot:XP_013409672.1 caspase-8-like [Lingula anatina]